MKKGAPNWMTIALVALVASLCLAACGSSSSASSSSTTTTASTSSARSKLAACLKAHGVTLPSRPGGFHGGGTGTTPNGGGFFGGGGGAGGAGGSFRNSKFATAFKDCGADFGFRGGAGGHFGAHFSTATLDSFVACVKKNGYTLPAPNTSGKGPIFPASIEKNAKFQAAAKSCESILRSAFRRPGGPSTSTTASS